MQCPIPEKRQDPRPEGIPKATSGAKSAAFPTPHRGFSLQPLGIKGEENMPAIKEEPVQGEHVPPPPPHPVTQWLVSGEETEDGKWLSNSQAEALGKWGGKKGCQEIPSTS